uniref:C3H1-type domain-containing protein n=1 Tax=Rhabditophanes sp. KR3021 TaxID=114890 RepID=A0AC35U9E8_9BILA
MIGLLESNIANDARTTMVTDEALIPSSTTSLSESPMSNSNNLHLGEECHPMYVENAYHHYVAPQPYYYQNGMMVSQGIAPMMAAAPMTGQRTSYNGYANQAMNDGSQYPGQMIPPGYVAIAPMYQPPMIDPYNQQMFNNSRDGSQSYYSKPRKNRFNESSSSQLSNYSGDGRNSYHRQNNLITYDGFKKDNSVHFNMRTVSKIQKQDGLTIDWTRGVCPSFLIKRHCANFPSCNLAHGYLEYDETYGVIDILDETNQDLAKHFKECWHFKEKGSCPKGIDCSFSHNMPRETGSTKAKATDLKNKNA